MTAVTTPPVTLPPGPLALGQILHEEPGLRIRGMRRDDHAGLLAVTTDPRVVRYVADGSVLTPDKVSLWIENQVGNYARLGYGTFTLADPADDRAFGWGGFVPPGPDRRPQPEIIYGMERARWGGGLGTRVARALMRLAFERFGLQEVVATVDGANAASLRILAGAGFRLDHVEEDAAGPVHVLLADRAGWLAAGGA